MEFGYVTPHEILIRCTANMGFIVQVGCQSFAFSNVADMMTALSTYLNDPEDTHKKFAEAIPSGSGGLAVPPPQPEVSGTIQEGFAVNIPDAPSGTGPGPVTAGGALNETTPPGLSEQPHRE